MPAGVVYHWKHGWIPLDHTAALSKAKGNHERATAMLSAAHSGDAGIHTRQDVAKAIRGLPAVPSEHRDHARAQVIDAAQQHNAADLLPSPMRRQQVGITQANHRAFGNNVEGRAQAASGGYREGQRIEHQVMNFSKPGFPTEWQPGTVEKVTKRPDGLTELTVRHDDGTATVEMVGKRGGNKKLRTLTNEPGHVADDRAVTAQQKAFDRIQQAHTARAAQLHAEAAAKRAEADRIAGNVGGPDRAAGRLSAQGLAQAHRNTDSSLQRFVAAQNAAAALDHKAGLAAARGTEAGRVRLTHDQIKGATHVQDSNGWHEAVRVNAKSVTVKTPYSWTDTIPHDKVRAVRTLTNGPHQPSR